MPAPKVCSHPRANKLISCFYTTTVHYSRTASELRLLVCKEGRLSELPLAVYVVAATAAHQRRRREAHGGQSESKRERGREAAAALLGTTKSIESRRDFPHFISAWPPPAFR